MLFRSTGVVGREILSILEEKKFEFNSIKMLASARSAGSKLDFMGKEYTVKELKENIILLGELENPYSVIKQCDIFALLFYYEGISLNK